MVEGLLERALRTAQCVDTLGELLLESLEVAAVGGHLMGDVAHVVEELRRTDAIHRPPGESRRQAEDLQVEGSRPVDAPRAIPAPPAPCAP